MDSITVSPDDKGLSTGDYGPNIVDRWKARAFQQTPGGSVPCCGYEEEATNWGGSSQLMGEKSGPVRTIRVTWGADSSTNNIRTEIFYSAEVRYQDHLRVHVIPPLDGIYVQRDMAAGRITTYRNNYTPDGVQVDGLNDEAFGNLRAHVGPDGAYVTDSPGSVIYNDANGNPIVVGSPNDQHCPSPCIHGNFDLPDPIPDAGFSPQGDIRYYQGDIGTHGLHILFITDSDNAQLTVPVDEIDSEQRQVILRGDPGNVGEQYGHSFDKPLVAAPTPVRIPLAPFDSLLSPIVVGIDDLAADTTCCDD